MNTILASLEYLSDNSLSIATISNDVAAVRAMFIVHNLPTLSYRDEKFRCLLGL